MNEKIYQRTSKKVNHVRKLWRKASVKESLRIVGIVMVCIGWYKKSKTDKKVFQYIKEKD